MSTRERSPNDGLLSNTGFVGIFWFIGEALDILVFDSIPLPETEPYGDCLTYPGGHYEYWESLRRESPETLSKQGLPAWIKGMEYEEFPRGRVVYDRICHIYMLYVDVRLAAKKHVARICEAFQLNGTSVEVRSDNHYRS